MSIKRFDTFHRDAHAKFMRGRHPVTLELLQQLSGKIDLTDEAAEYAAEQQPPDEEEDATDLG